MGEFSQTERCTTIEEFDVGNSLLAALKRKWNAFVASLKWAALKWGLRDIIANDGWAPDQESFNLLYQTIVGIAAEVCVVNDRGELLLHHRAFTEWPGEWSKVVSWYLPGGLVRTTQLTIQEACRANLMKDGVLNDIRFIGPCGSPHFWGKDEHPFGWRFVSVPQVCLLIGELKVKPGKEGEFKFVNSAVPSDVPNHTMFQEQFFAWRGQNLHLFKR